MWPPDDELCAAWSRLTADSTTAGPFAELVLPPLEADLRRLFPRADPHAAAEAADWAVAAFLRNPAAYDPARGPLAPFLRLAARRDLMNLLAADGRRRRGQIPWAGVELTHPAGNELADGESLADHPAVLAAAAALDDAGRRVLDLMLDGERDTAVFAEALGVSHLSPDGQADAVKRAKDRVKARLKRAGRGT